MARRKRRPGTWPNIKIHRGPDTTTHWAGPAFTLKSRAQAASHPSQYLDLFSNFKDVQVLGDRHQRVRKWAVKEWRESETHILRLFMGGDLYFYIEERIDRVAGVRILSASLNFPTLEVAISHRHSLRFKQPITLPLEQTTNQV